MGCRTLNRNGRTQTTAFSFPTPWRMFGYISGLNRPVKAFRLDGSPSRKNPDYIQGSFFLVRRDAFEAVGGFDEQFFMYAEDVDFCLRVRREGWTVRYVPEITITHYGGGSTISSLGALENFIPSLIRLYKKHRTAGDLAGLRGALRRGLAVRKMLWAGRQVVQGKPLLKDQLAFYGKLESLIE